MDAGCFANSPSQRATFETHLRNSADFCTDIMTQFTYTEPKISFSRWRLYLGKACGIAPWKTRLESTLWVNVRPNTTYVPKSRWSSKLMHYRVQQSCFLTLIFYVVICSFLAVLRCIWFERLMETVTKHPMQQHLIGPIRHWPLTVLEQVGKATAD